MMTMGGKKLRMRTNPIEQSLATKNADWPFVSVVAVSYFNYICHLNNFHYLFTVPEIIDWPDGRTKLQSFIADFNKMLSSSEFRI